LRDEHSSEGYAGAVTAGLTGRRRFADFGPQDADSTGKAGSGRHAQERGDFA